MDNEQEFKISGLTKRQVAMLDVMWTKGSTEEYEDWKASLSESDMNLADTLQTLLIMEMQEKQLHQVEKEAKSIISKMMKVN